MTENGNGLITIQIEVLAGLSVPFQRATSKKELFREFQPQNLTLKIMIW